MSLHLLLYGQPFLLLVWRIIGAATLEWHHGALLQDPPLDVGQVQGGAGEGAVLDVQTLGLNWQGLVRSGHYVTWLQCHLGQVLGLHVLARHQQVRHPCHLVALRDALPHPLLLWLGLGGEGLSILVYKVGRCTGEGIDSIAHSVLSGICHIVRDLGVWKTTVISLARCCERLSRTLNSSERGCGGLNTPVRVKILLIRSVLTPLIVVKVDIGRWSTTSLVNSLLVNSCLLVSLQVTAGLETF